MERTNLVLSKQKQEEPRQPAAATEQATGGASSAGPVEQYSQRRQMRPLSEVKCFKCLEYGHYAYKCPQRESRGNNRPQTPPAPVKNQSTSKGTSSEN